MQSLCVGVRSELYQNLAFVCSLNCVSASESSHMSGHMGLTSLFVCVRTLHSNNLPSVCVRGYSNVLPSVISFQHISQRTAFSGCGRDAPGCPAGGRGGWFMAELWQPQEVMPWDRIYLHIAWKKKLLWENDRLLFLKQTPHYRKLFRECTKTTFNIYTQTQRKFQREAETGVLLLKWRTVLIVKAVALIWPVYLRHRALGTFVLTLGRCIEADKVDANVG